MKRNTVFLTIAILLLASACVWAEPTVSNVSASQRGDGSRLVDVYYDLAETLGDWPYVTLKISTDGGTTYPITASTVTGDCKRNVAPGTGKHILWDAKTDMPDVSGNNYKAQVNASTCIGYAGPMITIAAGSFLMGPRSDDPYKNDGQTQRSVQLSEYRIGKNEVTRAEYAKFIETGGYSTQSFWSTDGWTWRTANSRTQPDYWASQQTWGTPPGQFTQTGRHPVVGVTYYEAEAYCNWANQYLPAGDGPYHLPTEAQWEKAARWNAGTSTPFIYPWGDTQDATRLNCSLDTEYPGNQTAPVASFPTGASPYGLMDMAGNTQEYIKDFFSDTYWSSEPPGGWVDPQGPASGTTRCIKGSSYAYPFVWAQSCCLRGDDLPSNSRADSGFRLAR